MRSARRFGASHAGRNVRVRRVRGEPRACGDHRRSRRCRASSGNDGGQDARPSHRRSGAYDAHRRHRLAALDRPDAAGRAGRDDGNRWSRQRRAVRRTHRCVARCRRRRSACGLRQPDARRGRLQRPRLKAVETIGVIGGGQLGRMFALDAKRMGYYVITLDPQEASPCGQVADEQIVAAYGDLDAIDELGRRSDVITYEFENIDIASVRHLEASSHRVTPSSSVLHVTQNRLREKQFVRDAGLATTPIARVLTAADLRAAAESVGFPAILKTAEGGYDGKGQWPATSPAEAEPALAAAGGAELIFERRVPLACELSVVATRNAQGEIVSYPIAENTHDRGILTMTVAPARVDAKVAKRAEDAAAI